MRKTSKPLLIRKFPASIEVGNQANDQNQQKALHDHSCGHFE
jgi:hypothetical protein